MNRNSLVLVASAVALAGGVIAFSRLGPSAVASADGGRALIVPAYQLPDGAPWPNDPDAGNVPVDPSSCGASPGLQTCTVMLPSGGYARYQIFVPADGGPWLYNSTVAFDCICATDAGACTQTDGGPLPLTGSYPVGSASGPGCVGRPCLERSGWTGAPAGCAP